MRRVLIVLATVVLPSSCGVPALALGPEAGRASGDIAEPVAGGATGTNRSGLSEALAKGREAG